MKPASKYVRVLEYALLCVGSLLLAIFVLAYIDRCVMSRVAVEQFEAKRTTSKNPTSIEVQPPDNSNATNAPKVPAMQSWSLSRIKAHHTTLEKSVETLGVLRIPKIDLEVPVLNGTNQFALNRGVGRIEGTSFPGQHGNIGIAGHRDGFFRGLKELTRGDSLELDTAAGKKLYVVDNIRITGPANINVLRAHGGDSLTLVTCYPFYFVGLAPQRYVVEASLNSTGAAERRKETQLKGKEQ